MRQLRFWYGDATEPALSGVELDVLPGEMLVLCGPSGGGKSTLLRAWQGIVPQLTGGALAGEVEVVDSDATRTPPHELAARGVTLVYQNALEGFVADRVDDEVAFGPESLGLPSDEIARRVDRSLRDVGLPDAGRRATTTLSGGEQQRVAIAAALALEPRVLLLDEPTAHLDERTAAEIVALLDRLRRERGVTVVIAEHRLGLVAPLADRIAIVVDGRIRGVGPPREVLRDPALPALGVPVPRALQVAVRLGITSTPITPAELAEALAERGARRSATHDPAAETATAPRSPAPRGGPTDDIALRFEHVSYRYPGAARDALSDVELMVHRGERVALVGPSAAGKTTLARLALGLARPTAGEITVLGMRNPATARVAPRVGLVVQNPMHQLLAETVEGEIALGLRGHDPSERRGRVDELLARFDLAPLRVRHPLSLSEGQRRRLALAATIAPRPELLVLDEPTLAQDEAQRNALASLVREAAAGGVAVLAITHDREFANDACDRVLAMTDGRVTADLPLSGEPTAVGALEAAGIPPADVPATALALSRSGGHLAARTVDDLVRAFS